MNIEISMMSNEYERKCYESTYLGSLSIVLKSHYGLVWRTLEVRTFGWGAYTSILTQITAEHHKSSTNHHVTGTFLVRVLIGISIP